MHIHHTTDHNNYDYDVNHYLHHHHYNNHYDTHHHYRYYSD